MTIYGDDAYLHLATVNIAEHLVTFKSELARVEKDLSETLEHQVKRIKKLSDQKESHTNTFQNLKDTLLNIQMKSLLLVFYP